MLKHFFISILFTISVSGGASQLVAQDHTIVKNFIIEPPTLIALGFEWYIEGDNNRNATVEVAYREKGTSTWKTFIPFLRIGNEQCGTPEWNYTTENMLAGSIFDLKPGTEYECQLTLSDPDGTEGQTRQVVALSTRREPMPFPSGQVRHVYPKDWSGEKLEPAYDGLLHAYYGYPRYADWVLTTDPVQAGDIILIHAGEYKADYKDYRDFHGLTFDGTYFLTQDGTEEQSIVIKAAGDGEVVFDGNGSAVLLDVTAADYHYFEGLTFRNTEVAIRAGLMNAYGGDGLTVKHCRFEDIGIGIQGQYEGSRYYYIADNTFVGREDTSKVYHHKLENGRNVQRLASYYAVKVHGQGHTVCYNQIRYFFDGIDICTHARPESDPEKKAVAIDFYNNDLFICNDNFIEADGGHHNIRILRNRGFNSGQQALSNQPVLGGPVYWVRNVVYNCGNASTFKFWGMYPAGILAYHNTSSGIFTRDDKPASNVHARNNLFLPSDDADLPSLGLYTYTRYSSLDYNGYRKRLPFIGYHAPGKEKVYDFDEYQTPVRYASLEKFRESTGQEEHGLSVDYDIFVDADPPRFKGFSETYQDLGSCYPIYHPGEADFRLKADASAVDRGVLLPGINEDFTGAGPDLGAYERGRPIPHYGPRSPTSPCGNNCLSLTEIDAGWTLLFDGATTAGWRGFNQDLVPPNWKVEKGALTADGSQGDIITDTQYEDFELSLEWKIGTGGNSGVFYHVAEGEQFDQVWRTGIEMQVMDNAKNPMAQTPENQASSVFAMYPPLKDTTKPAGQWNKARIIVYQGQVEYWLNGEKVNEYALWTDQWYADREKCLHNKKRKPLWGEMKSGHIALQDEGFPVSYRNIKIRRL